MKFLISQVGICDDQQKWNVTGIVERYDVSLADKLRH